MDLKIILPVIGLILLAGAIFYFLRRRRKESKYIHKLPLHEMGYRNIPAIPYQLSEIPGTLVRLGVRAKATTQAKWGMSNTYSIDNYKANGYSFLYGRGKDHEAESEAERQSLKADLEKSSHPEELNADKVKSRLNTHHPPLTASSNEDPITMLSLTEPEQFAMSWTTFDCVYEKAQKFFPLSTRHSPLTEMLQYNLTNERTN